MTNTTTNTTTTHANTDNIAIARRFIDEILNRGRFELLADLVHDDYRYIGPDGTELVGRAGPITDDGANHDDHPAPQDTSASPLRLVSASRPRIRLTRDSHDP